MFSFLLRAAGFLVLALALVAAVLDLTRSIASSKVLITSFSGIWSNFSASSLEAAREAVMSLLHPALWDPVISSIIALPGWLVLWLVSMLLLWAGKRRENPFGRFASR